MPEPRRLILASGSKARRDMLTAAGISFEVVPADVDEAALRDRLLGGDPPATAAAIAKALAMSKATAVAAAHPEALVVGGDQVLECDGALLSKPGNAASARAQLAALRGKTHVLHSAVCLARGGMVVWTECDLANMTMRDFSDAFLDAYLAEAGPAVTQSVGAYHLEGRGIQLFERIEGDYFTVLGMPLLPLVAALRTEGVVAT